MSYFAANTISLDRDRQAFRVKGGDSNDIPRMNYWIDWRPLRVLLADLVGGGIQLTTRSERAVHIDCAAREASAQIQELTGFSAYKLDAILRGGDRTTLAEHYRERIAHWQGDRGGHMSADYVTRQVAKLEHLLDILGDPALLEAIDAVNADFCRTVCQPVRGGTHVVTNGRGYISGTHRGRAHTTSDAAGAKRYSEAKARELAARFTGWTAQEVAA